ncbi:MAG: hypothetical protein KF729_24410 [Sandaracinaceae bacterium]|nr:hypothetical protein [Sandaracinaceae bacterium]
MARPPFVIGARLPGAITVTPRPEPVPSTPPVATERPVRPRVAPPAGGPAPGVVAPLPSTLEPPIPRVPPAGLDSQQLTDWVRARLADHEGLRARSFWETGHLIALLLPRGRSAGARDIKELVERAELGIAHMTAQKYVMVARSFEREIAVRTGIEKCYALTVYAKAIGREGQAAKILADDELIDGSDDGRGRRLRAAAISGVKLREAIRTLKGASTAPPTEVQREREAAAKTAQVYARKLGMTRAVARLVRHGGETKVAIYLPLGAAANLEAKAPLAALELVARLSRTDTAFAALARDRGLLRRAA